MHDGMQTYWIIVLYQPGPMGQLSLGQRFYCDKNGFYFQY